MNREGDRRVTMRAIAERAGVSLNTVSLALRDSARLSAETRRRVKRVADELGYRPDPLLAAGMARLRPRVSSLDVGGVLAVLHGNRNNEDALNLAGIRNLWTGCEERARELGYRAELWRVDFAPRRVKALARQLRARGIPGAVFLAPWTADMQAKAEPIVRALPTASCGLRFARPAVHGAMGDMFELVRSSFETVLRAGYRRPGLIVESGYDDIVGRRIVGGFGAEWMRLAEEDRVPPLMMGGRWDAEAVVGWWARWRPDVILTSRKKMTLKEWADLNPTPTMPGLVQVGVTEETPEWTGVLNPGREVGMAAVDLVIAQIYRGERGVPSFQKCIMIEGRWRWGDSCRPRS